VTNMVFKRELSLKLRTAQGHLLPGDVVTVDKIRYKIFDGQPRKRADGLYEYSVEEEKS
jgi:hypothetical protein